MPKTVLVTGGTGFIAGWAIVSLLIEGYEVRTTIRDARREGGLRAAVTSRTSGRDRLSFAVADLTRDEGWDRAVAGCQHVLHIASPLGRDAPRRGGAFVGPRRGGGLRVAEGAGWACVERVVMTSAAATARQRGS